MNRPLGIVGNITSVSSSLGSLVSYAYFEKSWSGYYFNNETMVSNIQVVTRKIERSFNLDGQ